MICRRVASSPSYVCVDMVNWLGSPQASNNIAQEALTVNPGRLSFGEAYLYAETTALFTRRRDLNKKALSVSTLFPPFIL
jgi:hypothetical protein